MLGGIGDAFADRNFRIYSVGNIVSWLSFFIQAVAVSWMTWDLTHSTTWLAAIAVLGIAPNILFLPLAGVMADRADRFHIVLVTMVLALFQALALSVLAMTGTLTIWPLAILTFLHGLIHSFSVPGLYGMMPRFVAPDRLSSAIAVNAAYSQFAIFAGPALAGWIILHHGVAVAFASNVAGYLVYLVSLAFLRTPPSFVKPPPSGRTAWGDLKDGVDYIANHRGILVLLLLMVPGDAMSAATYQMLPALADGLGGGVTGLSSLMSAAGLGATIAALWLAHGGVRRASPRLVILSFIALTIAVMALVTTSAPVAAAAIMVVFGCAGEIRRTGTVSLLQTAVVDRQRGRVMSSQFLLQRVAGGIGTAFVGLSAEHYSLRVSLLVTAILAMLGGLFAFAKREGISTAFEQSRSVG